MPEPVKTTDVTPVQPENAGSDGFPTESAEMGKETFEMAVHPLKAPFPRTDRFPPSTTAFIPTQEPKASLPMEVTSVRDTVPVPLRLASAVQP